MKSGSVPRKVSGHTSLRVVAYLGMDRPCRRTDYGELLIKKIIASRHELVGLIIHPSDNLADLARRYHIPYISIPLEFLQPASKIKKALADNPQLREFYPLWLDHIRSFGADIGVSVWSYWIPCELFSMPSLGFVNYHPAPLPHMRGMEPDTFAILEGRKEIWGTVHKVNHAFDCGEIVAWTKHIPVHHYDTPVSVLENLTREGITTIIHVLNLFADGTVTLTPQCAEEGSRTTREMARQASFVSWEHDTVEMLSRKLRAFCGQDIGIRLKGQWNGALHDVVDLEGYHGVFPGRPGEIIGNYKGRGFFNGAPIIRVTDGIAVVRFGKPITPLSYSSIFNNECPQQKLISPGTRRRQTKRFIVLKSLTQITP
jgi:methionyl-tRNA formyltransferase